jgi:hypothetical protein
MSAFTAVVIMRLGCFIVGLIAYGIACYFDWPHSGWILFPTIIAGLMCCSLQIQ